MKQAEKVEEKQLKADAKADRSRRQGSDELNQAV